MLSMTGFGAANVRENGLAVSVEMKAVNNRYFKLSLRLSDGYAFFEHRIESFLRKTIERGTLNVALRIRKENRDLGYRINKSVLCAYFSQIAKIAEEINCEKPRLDCLVALPGVTDTDTDSSENNEVLWKTVEKALLDALKKLQDTRQAEGGSMAKDLAENLKLLEERIGQVESLAPNVAPAYRKRLTERMAKIMESQGHTLNEADLVREVALFADRCDISEELVRFRSHLEQFSTAMKVKETCGKKLDFLIQELFRETNTIGSKANDAEITKLVVDMKTVIERMREMVQNVE